MTFDAREHARSSQQDYPAFDFIALDGATHELANPLTFTEREADELREDPKAFMAARWPEAHEAIQEMRLDVSQALIEAWMESAGDQGKSPSTSRATRRAEQRSKRTSRSAASTSTGSSSAK